MPLFAKGEVGMVSGQVRGLLASATLHCQQVVHKSRFHIPGWSIQPPCKGKVRGQEPIETIWPLHRWGNRLEKLNSLAQHHSQLKCKTPPRRGLSISDLPVYRWEDLWEEETNSRPYSVLGPSS